MKQQELHIDEFRGFKREHRVMYAHYKNKKLSVDLDGNHIISKYDDGRWIDVYITKHDTRAVQFFNNI